MRGVHGFAGPLLQSFFLFFIAIKIFGILQDLLIPPEFFSTWQILIL